MLESIEKKLLEAKEYCRSVSSLNRYQDSMRVLAEINYRLAALSVMQILISIVPDNSEPQNPDMTAIGKHFVPTMEYLGKLQKDAMALSPWKDQTEPSPLDKLMAATYKKFGNVKGMPYAESIKSAVEEFADVWNKSRTQSISIGQMLKDIENSK